LRQVADFENDLRKSRRITYEQWASRPWSEKLWERLLALFGSQL
jgi:cardiolipin synthase